MTPINARSIRSAWSSGLRSRLLPLTCLVMLAAGLLQPGSAAAQTTASQADRESRVQLKSAAGPQAPSKPAAGQLTAIPRTPAEIARAMGYFFLGSFLVASVIAVWFAIERIVVLRRGRVIPRPFVERFLEHLEQGKLDRDEALKLCEDNGSPVAAIFAHGIRKWGKPSVEVEQAIIDGGERQVSQLRKHLRVLNGVATVTPLLGLLGTVIGMIAAFNRIASTDAMGKPEELAVGIALALLTTAAGLLIAIPSLIVYMYLAGRVDALVMDMDQLAQNVVHLISAEGLSHRPIPAARARNHPIAGPHAAEQAERKAV